MGFDGHQIVELLCCSRLLAVFGYLSGVLGPHMCVKQHPCLMHGCQWHAAVRTAIRGACMSKAL